ncbi:MAG TPA: hypothetical protein VFZ53_01550 [Polyangiaceae bacterium]
MDRERKPDPPSSSKTAWSSHSSGSFKSPSHESQPASATRVAAPLPAPGTTVVQILCSSGSSLLEPTHAYLTAYCKARFGARASDKLSVAIYELLANAIAYGSLGDVVVEILEGTVTPGVRVANNTTMARIGMLNGHVSKLRADPGKTLLDEMKRSSSGTVRPMLGLVRVVHEVGCQLDVSVTGQRVVVTAFSRG